jgi:hypothetical protein
MLRPHPRQRKEWVGTDLTEWGDVALSVSDFQNSDQHLFNCLHHAAALIELNTSAAIDAALTGTPVFTVMAPEYRAIPAAESRAMTCRTAPARTSRAWDRPGTSLRSPPPSMRSSPI